MKSWYCNWVSSSPASSDMAHTHTHKHTPHRPKTQPREEERQIKTKQQNSTWTQDYNMKNTIKYWNKNAWCASLSFYSIDNCETVVCPLTIIVTPKSHIVTLHSGPLLEEFCSGPLWNLTEYPWCKICWACWIFSGVFSSIWLSLPSIICREDFK